MFTGLQDHRKVQTGRNLRRSHSSTSCTKQSPQWFTFPHTFKFWCLNYLIDTWLEVPNWEEVLAVNNQLHPVQICAFMFWNDGMVSWGFQLLKPLLCLTLSWKLYKKKGSFCCPPPHTFQSRIRNLVINHFKTEHFWKWQLPESTLLKDWDATTPKNEVQGNKSLENGQ